MLTNLGYFAAVPYEKRPVLARLRYWQLYRVWCDSMHGMCIGTTPLACGNVIAWLVRNSAGGTQEQRLHALYVRYRKWCHARRISDYTDAWTKDSLSWNDHISLKSKAAAMKRVVRFLLDVVLELPQDSLEAKLVVGVTWGIAEYYRIIMTSGRYLPDEVIDALDTALTTAFLSYNALAAQEHAAGGFHAWHVVSKFHMNLHLVRDFVRNTRVNPRFTYCYKDEDFMRVVKSLAIHSHPATLPQRVLERWLLCICVTGWRPLTKLAEVE